MFGRIHAALRSQGPRGLLSAVGRRLLRQKARAYSTCAAALRDTYGLEVGGPSPMFRRGGLLPVYPLFARLDNCNFSPTTVWEGTITQGRTFISERRREPGHQFVAEAMDLRFAGTGQYDALLSSHTIEHMANPIATLKEWIRVVRPGGTLVVVVPHHEGTFDQRRPVTTLTHLEEDYAAGTGEDDQTHVAEILALHDLTRDPAAGSPAAFRARSGRNPENRCLHHHVFDTRLLARLLDLTGLQLHFLEPARPYHIIAVAQTLAEGLAPDNRRFLAPEAQWLEASPFARDRSGANA